MVKKAIFLFPGQGAQYPGMGLDLIEASAAARKVFDTASEVLNMDMAALIRDSDAETLKRTDVSQIAISAVSLAAAAFLGEKGITPAACAGFSLGEYPALRGAGVISVEDCFLLVNARGKAMRAAIDRLKSSSSDIGMAAVVGLEPAKVEALIVEMKNSGLKDIYAANINSSKQIVVSGTINEEVENRFKEAGAKRVIRLQVAGPFHSPFMKEAADAFAPVLDKTRFNDPAIPVFSNVTGKQIQSGVEAKALALRQIVESVRWTCEQAAFSAVKAEALLEVGPGKVLQGLWKDTGSEIPCFSAGAAVEIELLAKE